MFKVEKLSKHVNGKAILNNVDFEIGHGEIGIFLGGSGVGKSTLLRVLNHLETCDNGTFTLDAIKLNLDTVNKNHVVGMVFQHFNLFENLTVEGNITLALTKLMDMNKEEAISMAQKLLNRYGLGDKSQSSVKKLSGGQKQRLAIARTIALNPKIICLDEPTSALDPRLTAQVANYINDLATDNRIVLLATHDTGLIAQLKGKIFLMKSGTIIETTSTEAYSENPLRYPMLHNFLTGYENENIKL